MKKMILFLACVLIFSMSNNVSFSAGEDNDAVEIKRTVEAFATDISGLDTNSAMKFVSANYSDQKDKETIGYAELKAGMEKLAGTVSKRYIDTAIDSLRLNNLNVQGDRATVDIEYNTKGFNLDTLKEDITKIRRKASLAKENGVWMITRWVKVQG